MRGSQGWETRVGALQRERAAKSRVRFFPSWHTQRWPAVSCCWNTSIIVAPMAAFKWFPGTGESQCPLSEQRTKAALKKVAKNIEAGQTIRNPVRYFQKPFDGSK